MDFTSSSWSKFLKDAQCNFAPLVSCPFDVTLDMFRGARKLEHNCPDTHSVTRHIRI
jgi:hypothetical protein